MTAFATTAFFEKTYDEALALARDAQRYFVDEGAYVREEAATGDIRRDLDATVAGLRLVARVTHVVAWLMEQKAIGAGEIDGLAAAEHSEPLIDILTCLKNETAERIYPPRLLALLERSRRLYERVARLDEMLRRTLH